MTYTDIKQRVYDLLWPITEAEARRVGYSDKIHRIFNEATFRIAHAILPNIQLYKVKLSRDKLPAKVSMPPDFISFCEEQNAYVNGHNFVLTKFVGHDSIILDGNEAEDFSNELEYHIYYNALYPQVINGGMSFRLISISDCPKINADNFQYIEIPTIKSNNDSELSYELPEIVGHLIPHYIVGQLLSLDDKIRSTEELNAFETLLATVNVDRNERQREYHSVRGWY